MQCGCLGSQAFVASSWCKPETGSYARIIRPEVSSTTLWDYIASYEPWEHTLLHYCISACGLCRHAFGIGVGPNPFTRRHTGTIDRFETWPRNGRPRPSSPIEWQGQAPLGPSVLQMVDPRRNV